MKAVIIAGGRGSRLMPLTKNLPKPLVPILDKPIIHYILEGVRKAGIEETVLTLGYLGRKIQDYVEKNESGLNIRYVYEDVPLGTAGGVKNAEKYLDEDFLVLSGDAFTDIDIKELIEYHYRKKGRITIATHKEKNPSLYGVVESDETGKITYFEEKPMVPKSDAVNTGIYVMDRSVLDVIPKGFCDFSKDVFPKKLGEIYAYRGKFYWSDIGTLPSYYRTNYYFATRLKSSVEG